MSVTVSVTEPKLIYQIVGPWSTDEPTEDGWYWTLKGNIDEPIPEIVFALGDMNMRHDERGVYDYPDMPLVSFSFFTHWLGPLPKPEPPT